MVRGSQSSTNGNMQANPSMQNTTSESMAAHGIVLAVNAPKISLSIGTDSFKEAINELLPQTITSGRGSNGCSRTCFRRSCLLRKARATFSRLTAERTFNWSRSSTILLLAR